MREAGAVGQSRRSCLLKSRGAALDPCGSSARIQDAAHVQGQSRDEVRRHAAENSGRVTSIRSGSDSAYQSDTGMKTSRRYEASGPLQEQRRQDMDDQGEARQAVDASNAGLNPETALARPPDTAMLSRSLMEAVLKTRGLSPNGRVARMLEPLVGSSLRRWVNIFAEFDRICAMSDFVQAARSILPTFASGVEVIGADYVPREGPVLLVSNHPGNFDELVIASALNRSDLRVFANTYPILTDFPNISRHVVFSRANDPNARMNAVRNGIKHLRRGNLLMLFPTGRTDPDPRMTEGARESLSDWSKSVELMVHKAPETRVVVTMVSGVSSPMILRTPPALFRRPALERQKLAGSIQMAVQILFPRWFNLVPRISFSDPMTLGEMTKGNASTVREAIIRQAERWLELHALQRPVVEPLHLRP